MVTAAGVRCDQEYNTEQLDNTALPEGTIMKYYLLMIGIGASLVTAQNCDEDGCEGDQCCSA